MTPEYLGLGYIIGPRIAGELASGGVLSWLALIPLISIFVAEGRIVQDLKNLGFTDAWMAGHTHAEWIYRAYVRYIGAGAVACAGVMTLLKTLPTIVSAFRESVKSFGKGGEAKSAVRAPSATSAWASSSFGSLVLALLITILPNFPHGPFPGSLLMGLLVVVFGFFFVTVSSRIVGHHRDLVEPDLGHDDRDDHGDLRRVRGGRPDGRRLPGGGALRRRDRLRRGRQRGRDLAGPEDRVTSSARRRGASRSASSSAC